MARHPIGEHYSFIKRIKKSTPKNREKYLNKASPAEIRSLCECAHNVYSGAIPIPSKIVKRLRPHQKEIRELTFKRGKAEHKRQLLIQKGGFLPLLLGAVLPIIGQLIANAVG